MVVVGGTYPGWVGVGDTYIGQGGYLPWPGGEGTYPGWGEGLPTLAGERVPTLTKGEEIHILAIGEGYLQWTGGTCLGGYLPW